MLICFCRGAACGYDLQNHHHALGDADVCAVIALYLLSEIVSHMARRTFVGNLFKKFKDQSLISELSGHVPNSREFARYREIDSELKKEMVSIIE